MSEDQTKPTTDTEESQENPEVQEQQPEVTLDDPVAALEAQLSEQKDKYLRLYSEFENFRRRTAKERIALTQTAGKKIIEALLPVLDDFERAEKSFPKAAEGQTLDPMVVAQRDSVKLIHHKLKRTLEQQGLKAMESTIGQDFDADLHEAITQIPAPSEEMKGKVVDQIEQGYYLGDQILRFAKVVVGA